MIDGRKVFLSYRREDTAGVAGRIFDRLEAHFGRDNVFMDVDAIPFGVDFRDHIREAVGRCDVFLAVIGPAWSGESGGRRRIDSPRDFVRLEVEAALARGIPVIPVLVAGSDMPAEDSLPASLGPLTYRNAIVVDQGRDFRVHVERLIRGIVYHFGRKAAAAPPPPPPPPPPPVSADEDEDVFLPPDPPPRAVSDEDDEFILLPDPPPPVIPAARVTRAAAGQYSAASPLGMKLLRVGPGEFLMGLTDDQIARLKGLFPGAAQNINGLKYVEQPVRVVSISRPFYLATCQVTVGQFRRFVESTGYKTEGEKDGKGGFGWDRPEPYRNAKFTWRAPGFPQDDDHPVVLVSWNDARAFIHWLNTSFPAPGHYRLPTEAEWEYACRAGTTTLFSGGDDNPGRLASFANVADASLRRQYPGFKGDTIADDDGHVFTAPVGSYAAVGGLYDMIGNVWEWCEDRYGQYEKAPDSGSNFRVFRGGSFQMGALSCRPSARNRAEPRAQYFDLGFRVAAGLKG